MSEETPHTEQQETPSAERHELPPASFGVLIFSLRFQAEMHLGLVPLDEDEKPPIDLAAAQHYIDLLGILAGKTRGNLEIEEQRYLENSLTELRFRDVQAAGQVQIK